MAMRSQRRRLLRMMVPYVLICALVIFGYRRLVMLLFDANVPFVVRILDEVLLASLGAVFLYVWVRQVEHSRRVEQESAERLRIALDSSPDVFVILDPDRKVEFVNRRGKELAGQTEGTLIGRSLREILPSETAVVLEAAMERAIATRIAQYVDVPFAAHLGPLTLETRTVPICDARGAVRQILGVAHDITDRVRAEEAVQRSERRYRSLVEYAADAVALVDGRGKLLRFSTIAGTRVLGYSEEETEGRSLFEFVHPEDRAAARDVLTELLAHPSTPITTALRVRHKNGEWRWIEGVASNRLDDPDVAAIIVNYGDVTERKTAELRLALALAAAKMGIWEWATQPDRIYWSKECYEIFHVQSFDGRPDTWWSMIHPQDREGIWTDLQRSRQNRVPFETEFRIIRGDGLIRWVSNLGQGVFGADGQALSFIGTVWDITERKQREAERLDLLSQLRGLTGRLAEVDEAERREIARELHDSVGQNLVALDLDLALLRRLLPADGTAPDVTSRLSDATKLVNETVNRVRHVLSDLRPPALDDLGLFAALEWHVERFAERLEIPVRLDGSEFDPRLPPQAEMALFRIAQEALVNVARHARARQVIVSLEDRANGAVLTVEDDGVGIVRTGSPGWGIISMRERAESIGGRLVVESRLGGGTRVTVEVPREEE